MTNFTRATRFEFEQRFWIIGALFGVGFYLYAVDRTNIAVAILRVMAPRLNPDSEAGNNAVRLIFASGAVLVFVAAFLRTWATAYLRTEIVHDAAQHSEALVADRTVPSRQEPVVLREPAADCRRRAHGQPSGLDCHGARHVGVRLPPDPARRRRAARDPRRLVPDVLERGATIMAGDWHRVWLGATAGRGGARRSAARCSLG